MEPRSQHQRRLRDEAISLITPRHCNHGSQCSNVKLYRSRYISKCTSKVMGLDNFPLISQKTHANFRLCNVSGYTTNLLEIRAEDPSLHVLFIPGNPAVGHISQTEKNWEHGRLFSLEEQIDHKIDFIKHELQNSEVPIILVIYCIGLYPFLAVNTESSKQATIKRLATSPILSAAVSSVVGLLGLLPTRASRFLVTKSVGKSWSTTAVDALCTHVLQYHVIRNVLFLAMTEFKKLSETPDWTFMRGKQSRIAFLFGVGDHWGPLQMFDEISKNVPDVALAIEREGHSHAFSCTKAGSLWVAQHVASLIKNWKTSSS
ncbi:hypothetical protein HYC85_025305 [Camellia sinensis]|uniref:AB hydrolase-1 domain-containing protein n=1 Tax=Camellia sinensis TaxID=4442 RepID=A0A7J7GAM7_CAMSI|nr:hypothetical protein HYC85_025305 [Camellia sinensis]